MRIGLLALVAAVGCGTETGVLIEVTRDESVPDTVDALEFHVGIDKIDGFPTHFADLDPEETIELDDRDLLEDPYRLMLRANDHAQSNMMVAVVAYDQGQVVGFGDLDAPVTFMDGVVAEWTIVLGAGLPAGYTVTETGCVRYVDDQGQEVAIGIPGDQDCDGFGEDDCDDFNPDASPAANETCGNEIDDDCDGAADEDVDEDGDLVTTCGGDCDDGRPGVNPNEPERCDGHDNDCNGLCDEDIDGDGDHVTVCGSTVLEDGTCFAFDPEDGDCDDGDSFTYPGAAETCDGLDNNCDGVCDDDSGNIDRDDDFYTSCGSVVGQCGLADHLIDCEPDIGHIHPGAPEVCDGVDDDCDGVGLTTQPCFAAGADTCESGFATCDDTGDGTLGSCTPPETPDTVPVDLCDAYGTCTGTDPDDPYTCSLEDSQAEDIDCKAHFLASTGQQCPVREVVLPVDQLEVCDWTVVGGTIFGNATVGVRPASQAVAPTRTTDVCIAALSVLMAMVPQETSFLLLRGSDDGSATYNVHVFTVPVESCTGEAGLECNGLSVPPDL